MRNQTKLHLQQLQLAMQKLDLWQAVPPSQDAFLSEEPFAIDTMSPEEWLQWIFIPRMAFKEAEEDFLVELLTPLRELEALLQNQ
ncbi:MAG: YqcC family protein [Haemophilus parainfluenzae]|nr:YqcC family protein [Haemophilus parainfluenzae]